MPNHRRRYPIAPTYMHDVVERAVPHPTRRSSTPVRRRRTRPCSIPFVVRRPPPTTVCDKRPSRRRCLPSHSPHRRHDDDERRRTTKTTTTTVGPTTVPLPPSSCGSDSRRGDRSPISRRGRRSVGVPTGSYRRGIARDDTPPSSSRAISSTDDDTTNETTIMISRVGARTLPAFFRRYDEIRPERRKRRTTMNDDGTHPLEEKMRSSPRMGGWVENRTGRLLVPDPMFFYIYVVPTSPDESMPR
jgi:hypothetical protein